MAPNARIQWVKRLKNESVKAIYRARREWVNNYKAERGCALCPEKNPFALDFHHRNKYEKNIHYFAGDSQ